MKSGVGCRFLHVFCGCFHEILDEEHIFFWFLEPNRLAVRKLDSRHSGIPTNPPQRGLENFKRNPAAFQKGFY